MPDIDKAIQTIAEGMGGGIKREPMPDEEQERRMAEAVKSYGPRISKLSEKDRISDAVSRVAEKVNIGMGLGEADLDTTSAEPIVGAAESALSLSSGILTWGAGKVFAGGPRLMGDTESAERIEQIVGDLAYQPYTESGKELIKPISYAIETLTKPPRWWGEKVQKTLIDPMKGNRKYWGEGAGHAKASDRAVKIAESFKWFGELWGELFMFKVAHGTVSTPVKAVKQGRFNLKANKFLYEDAIKTLEYAEGVHTHIANNPNMLEFYRGKIQRVRQADGTIKISKLDELHDIKANHEAIAQEKRQAINVLQEAGGDFQLVLENLDGWRSTHTSKVEWREEVSEHFEKLERAKTDPRYSNQIEEIDSRFKEAQVALAKHIEDFGTTGFHKDMVRQYDNVEVQLKKQLKASQKHPLVQRLFRKSKYGLEIKDLIVQRHGNIKSAELDSETFIRDREASMSAPERSAVPFIIEKIPAETIRRLANEGKVSHEVADIVANPTPELLVETKLISDYYGEAHKFLLEHFESVGFHADYVNRMWDLNKVESKELGAYFTTKNPYMKGRKIPSLVEGLDRGLKLKTTDIGELLRVYDSYKIKTAFNNTFAEAVKGMTDPEFGKLMSRYKDIPEAFKTEFIEVPYPELKRAVYRGKTAKGTPIIDMANIHVHKSIKPYVDNIFGKRWKNPVLNGLEAINAYQKKLNLAFSAFHHIALAEAGAGWGVGTKSFMESVKGLKEGKTFAMSSDGNMILTKDALRAGVKIDPLPDHHVHQVQQGLDTLARRVMDKNKAAGWAAEKIANFNKGWDRALWDHYHSTLKVMAYEKGVTAEMGRILKEGKLGEMTPKEIRMVKQKVAKFVNDSFGGQLWEIYEHGGPKAQQLMQLAILSPDWLISTLKQTAAPLRGLTGNKVAGRLGTKFWVKAALYQLAIIQGLNLMSSKKLHDEYRFTWENAEGRKSYALLPWRSDQGMIRWALSGGEEGEGQEVYLRLGKQFRELYEMMTQSLTKSGGKMSPVMQVFFEQFTGAAPGSGFPAEWKRKPHESELKLRGKSLLEDIAPFSVRAYLNEDRPAPVAFSLPVVKGMSKYQAHEQLVEALQNNEDLTALRGHILENRLPYKQLLKQAEGSVKRIEGLKYKTIAKSMYRKFKNSSMSMVDFLDIERDKSGMVPKEWREVRRRFKKFVKEESSVRRQMRRYGIDQHLTPY